jgi:HlyD family secretion protein
MTADVERGDLRVEVSANGTLEPTRTVSIGSELSGIVSRVLVDVNDTVTAGQVLIELDTAKLKAQVQQAEASLESAKANEVEAKAVLAEAQTKYQRLLKVHKLSGGKTPSQSELDEQVAVLERAKASVATAQAKIKDAEATLQTKRTDLSKAFITSPIDGVVLSRSVEPGYAVAASLQAVELLTLATDLRKLELEVDVDEADVSLVKPGQKATFTVSAYPNRNFPASLEKVAFGPTMTSNVVTYTSYLTVNNQKGLLRPGMTATARIVTDSRENVLMVPNTALRFSPKQATENKTSAVNSLVMPARNTKQKTAKDTARQGLKRERTLWVLKDGKLESVKVVTGATDGSKTEIVSGDLSEGAKVVTGQLRSSR